MATLVTEVPVHLLVGDDAALLSDALIALVHELVGDGDRALMVEELTEESYRTDGGFDIARLVDAAQTAPFLTERRVVIGRHMARFSRAEDLAPLYGYLDDVLPSTSLVLVWERGENPRQDRLAALPKKLNESVRAAGRRGDRHRDSVGEAGRRLARRSARRRGGQTRPRRAPASPSASAKTAVASSVCCTCSKRRSVLPPP